ncbi:unnamed protein product [Closterium sp. NIES-64]|nr:unnamed protein product [Closterium sp. NIES-64]
MHTTDIVYLTPTLLHGPSHGNDASSPSLPMFLSPSLPMFLSPSLPMFLSPSLPMFLSPSPPCSFPPHSPCSFPPHPHVSFPFPVMFLPMPHRADNVHLTPTLLHGPSHRDGDIVHLTPTLLHASPHGDDSHHPACQQQHLVYQITDTGAVFAATQ